MGPRLFSLIAPIHYPFSLFTSLSLSLSHFLHLSHPARSHRAHSMRSFTCSLHAVPCSLPIAHNLRVVPSRYALLIRSTRAPLTRSALRRATAAFNAAPAKAAPQDAEDDDAEDDDIDFDDMPAAESRPAASSAASSSPASPARTGAGSAAGFSVHKLLIRFCTQ